MKLKLVFLVLISQTLFSQQKIIDSLSTLVKTPISDSLKIKAYGDLSWYYGNISIDSAFYYGNLALDLSKKTNNLVGEAQSYNDIGILHYRISEFDNSINLYHKSLKIRGELKDTLGIASLYNKLGISFQKIFKMDSAIFYGTKALKIYSDNGIYSHVGIIKNNIANIYNDLKQYSKALKTHLEVAEIRIQTNDLAQLTYSYNNIGNSYLYMKDTVRSIEYYLKAIQIAEENNYETELATVYNNYGTILMNQNKTESALNIFNKAYALREKLKDNYGLTTTLINIGFLYLKQGDLKRASKNFHLALINAKNTNAKEHEMLSYSSLLDYQIQVRNVDSITHYLSLYNGIKDSIFNSRITKEVADVQEKYNTVEREKEIAQQKEELLLQELEIKTKNLYALLLVFGLLILGFIIYFIYKKKQQLSKELELKDALAIAQTQNRLQDQRLRISRDLHDNIGSQLTFIISSIDNLKFLVKSSDEKLKSKLTNINNFASNTISQLRDTIWAMNKNEITYEDFQGRTLALIEKAKLAKDNIQFSFNNNVKSNIVFSSVVGINIFRVLQEAVNNSLKYANASQINIDIIELSDTLNINIKDNGDGFDPNKVDLGNGLENMQRRIEEVGGILEINAKTGTGTKIDITIPKAILDK